MEMSMSKTTITILTTAAALVAASVPAAAAPDARCIGYANRAVSQQMANVNRGCGYIGPRWHTWWDGHYAWCRSKTPNRLAAETVKRNKKLGQCFG
jgi:hypothetical protein